MQKICNKCKIEKELTEFYRNKTCKDGHVAMCKHCTKLQADGYSNKTIISKDIPLDDLVPERILDNQEDSFEDRDDRCVYADYRLIGSKIDKPFYIGMGTFTRFRLVKRDHNTNWTRVVESQQRRISKINISDTTLSQEEYFRGFRRVLLAKNLSSDAAFDLEESLIRKYGRIGLDKGGCLVNRSLGGRGSQGCKIEPVESYIYKDGDFLKIGEYSSMIEASYYTGLPDDGISKSTLRNTVSGVYSLAEGEYLPEIKTDIRIYPSGRYPDMFCVYWVKKGESPVFLTFNDKTKPIQAYIIIDGTPKVVGTYARAVEAEAFTGNLQSNITQCLVNPCEGRFLGAYDLLLEKFTDKRIRHAQVLPSIEFPNLYKVFWKYEQDDFVIYKPERKKIIGYIEHGGEERIVIEADSFHQIDRLTGISFKALSCFFNNKTKSCGVYCIKDNKIITDVKTRKPLPSEKLPTFYRIKWRKESYE